MTHRERLVELTGDPELLFADGFDDAIIGVCERFGEEPFVVYDRAKVIDLLARDGGTIEDAEEFFAFNVIGAWAGPRTPAYVALLDAQ